MSPTPLRMHLMPRSLSLSFPLSLFFSLSLLAALPPSRIADPRSLREIATLFASRTQRAPLKRASRPAVQRATVRGDCERSLQIMMDSVEQQSSSAAEQQRSQPSCPKELRAWRSARTPWSLRAVGSTALRGLCCGGVSVWLLDLSRVRELECLCASSAWTGLRLHGLGGIEVF